MVGLLTTNAQMAPDGIEVSEIFEVPLALLANEKSYERKTLVRKGLKVPYYAVVYENYRIWGATAGMLRDLQNKITRAL